MKIKALQWLSLVVKFASLVTGLAAVPQLHMLPPEWMGYATLAFAGASVLKDSANRIGDLLDDGKANNSFKSLALFLLPLFCLTSCANDMFLGVSKEGWQAIAKEAGAGALRGASAAALPAYAEQRAKTSAKAVSDPTP
jgi:hypothetical protein